MLIEVTDALGFQVTLSFKVVRMLVGYFPFNEVGAPRTGHPRRGPSDVLGVFPLSSAAVLSSARALGRMLVGQGG